MGLRFPDLHPANSARVAGATGRTTNTEATVPAQPTLPELRRIDPAPLAASLDVIAQERIALGVTPAEMAAERIEDARPELIEAMKMLDSDADRDLHLRLGNHVAGLDDFCALLKERGRS